MQTTRHVPGIAQNVSRLLKTRPFWGEVKSMVALGQIPDPPFLVSPKTCTVIGAPTSMGQPLAGTDRGPKMIRDAGLHQNLTKLRWRVEEQGDLQFPSPSPRDPTADPELVGGNAHNCFVVGRSNQLIADAVYTSATAGKFPLVLGGDHSAAVGSLAGVLRARPNVGVVWVDAHADINTPEWSPSGNMHGMPVGIVMEGLARVQHMPGFEWLVDGPRLKSEDGKQGSVERREFQPDMIVYVGLRDLDAKERVVLRKLNIKAFTMQHVDRYGIGKVMEMTLDHLLERKQRPLHLSYDIDAVDPMIAPSTGTIVRGGLTYREAHYVAESVSETGMLGSMDMVEVNPSLVPGSGANETADVAVGIVTSAMGSRIL